MPFDFLLNREAARTADDRFFAEHPDFFNRNGSRMNRNWCIGWNKKLKAEWYRYYREAKLELQAAAVPDPRDDVDPVAPVNQCPDAAEAPFCTPISAVKLTSVIYPNKFIIYAEEEKWTFRRPPPYPPVDWTPEMEKPNPVVVHFDDRQAFAMHITYRVEDDDACPDTGVIQSLYQPNKDGVNYLSHALLEDMDFIPKTEHEADMKGNEFPMERIGAKLGHGNRMQAVVGPRAFEMGRPNNDIYLTWGEAKMGVYPEDGPTKKRMHAAVLLAHGAETVDEFKVIEHIFNLFPGYTLGLDHLPEVVRKKLQEDKEALKTLSDTNWPRFHAKNQTEEMGAWPIMNHPEYYAECQAICRLVRAVMRQLGAKSEMVMRTYTADFSNPTRVLDAGRATGPNPKMNYALVDRPVEVGKTYSMKSSVGFNNFEAYLRVKSPGMDKPRLLGGGTGLLAEGAHPLSCFQAFVEFKPVKRLVRKGDGDERVWERQWLITKMFDYKKEGCFADWNGDLP